MAGHKVKIPGYRIDKAGKLVKSTFILPAAHLKGLSVSKKIAQRTSKKISVKRRSP